MENKINKLIKEFDPSTKYIKDINSMSLDSLISEINSKKTWNLKEAKLVTDQLYEFKKKFYINKDKSKEDSVKFYINYMNHQIDVLNNFQSHLLTLIATIFLPLTFVTGIFGMNFKNMGVPSLKVGVFNVNDPLKRILIFSIITLITIIYIFYGILKIG